MEKGDLAPLPAATVPKRALPEEQEPEESAIGLDGSPLEVLADELLVSDEARPLFLRILAQRLPVPLVGEDVAGQDGLVLGSPELSWEEHRVAILLLEQECCRKALEGDGWRCFGMPVAEDNFDALCQILARER